MRGRLKGRSQRRLGQAGLAGDRRQTDVDQDRDLLDAESFDQLGRAAPLVADADYLRGRTVRHGFSMASGQTNASRVAAAAVGPIVHEFTLGRPRF